MAVAGEGLVAAGQSPAPAPVPAPPPPPPSNLFVKVFNYFSTEKRKTQDETTPLLGASRDRKPGEKTVFYLAYGSNMSNSTFVGRRGIRPLSSTNVLCPGETLVFDLDGIAYFEPCFANIREVPAEKEVVRAKLAEHGSVKRVVDEYMAELDQLMSSRTGEVWGTALIGVVYEVTQEDYATIIRTEGAGSGYDDVEVECFVLPKASDPDHKQASTSTSTDVSSIRARVLRAPPDKINPVSTSQASPRYHNLLVTGAKEHSLPPSYITYLESLHSYRRTSWRQEVGGTLFCIQWIVPMMLMVSFEKKLADKKTGIAPGWWVTFRIGLLALMWGTYRWFYKPVWGDGQRTIGDETGMARQPVVGKRMRRESIVVDKADLDDAIVDAEGQVVDAVTRAVRITK